MEMQIGEVATLKVTSDYAYGEAGVSPTIPPNSDLEFEVELLAVGEDKATSDWSSCVVM